MVSIGERTEGTCWFGSYLRTTWELWESLFENATPLHQSVLQCAKGEDSRADSSLKLPPILLPGPAGRYGIQSQWNEIAACLSYGHRVVGTALHLRDYDFPSTCPTIAA